jgi:hypothetical protein
LKFLCCIEKEQREREDSMSSSPENEEGGALSWRSSPKHGRRRSPPVRGKIARDREHQRAAREKGNEWPVHCLGEGRFF